MKTGHLERTRSTTVSLTQVLSLSGWFYIITNYGLSMALLSNDFHQFHMRTYEVLSFIHHLNFSAEIKKFHKFRQTSNTKRSPSTINLINASLPEVGTFRMNFLRIRTWITTVIQCPHHWCCTFYFRYSRWFWISLNSGKSLYWSLSTTVNLTRRADTGQINSSPVSASIPIVRVQSGCSQVIRIPVEDPDGDVVRCRWATGSNECGGICHAFKHADLDEVQRNRKRHNSLHHTTAATSTDSFLFSSNSFVTLFSIKVKWRHN